jgi:hypothetical protein
MTKQPEGGKTPNESNKPGKPAIDSDTFVQVPNDDQVKGGRAMRTDNPSKVDAYCCGE